MGSLFIVLMLVAIIGLIVGLTKPEVVKLKSRKAVTLAFGGATIFLFVCLALVSPATPTVTTSSTPVTQAPTVKKVVATQPVVTTPVQAPAPVVAPVVTPTQPTVLLDVSGQGTKSTQTFTTPSNNWQLSYTYDCSAFGSQGNFQIYVQTSDGGLSDLTPVNELGESGSDTEYYHEGGSYYLEVNSECSWTVQVKG